VHKGKLQCPFCKGPNLASLCETIKGPKQRSDIVRQERLCFNRLGHHKISSCNSKHRCHHCQWRHHTSLCTYGQQPLPTISPQCTAVTNITQPTEQGNSTTRPISLQPSSLQPIIPPSSQANTPLQAKTGSFSVTVPPQQKNVCLLKTAIHVATVSYGRRNAEAYILLDEISFTRLLDENTNIAI